MPKVTVKAKAKKEVNTNAFVFNVKEIKENLGECHDGDAVRFLMNDGTYRVVPIEDVPEDLLTERG